MARVPRTRLTGGIPSVSGQAGVPGFVPQFKEPERPRTPQAQVGPLIDPRIIAQPFEAATNLITSLAQIGTELAVRKRNLRNEGDLLESKNQFQIEMIDKFAKSKKAAAGNPDKFTEKFRQEAFTLRDKFANSLTGTETKNRFLSSSNATIISFVSQASNFEVKLDSQRALGGLDLAEQNTLRSAADSSNSSEDIISEFESLKDHYQQLIGTAITPVQAQQRARDMGSRIKALVLNDVTLKDPKLVKEFLSSPNYQPFVDENGIAPPEELLLTDPERQFFRKKADIMIKTKARADAAEVQFLKDDDERLLETTGHGLPGFNMKLAALNEFDPAQVKEINLERELALERFQARGITISNLDRNQGLEELKRFTPKEGPGFANREESFAKMMDFNAAWWKGFDKEKGDRGAWIDTFFTNNPEQADQIIGLEGDYATLPLSERIDSREKLQNVMGVRIADQVYLSNADRAKFLNDMSGETDIAKKSAIAKGMFENLGNRRYLKTVGEFVKDGMPFGDFLIINYVDLPISLAREPLEALAKMSAFGITPESIKVLDKKGDPVSSKINLAVIEEFDDNYGLGLPAEMFGLRGNWTEVLTGLALFEFQNAKKTIPISEDDAAKVAYKKLIGNLFDTYTVGNGIQKTISPRFITVPLTKTTSTTQPLPMEDVQDAGQWLIRTQLKNFDPVPGQGRFTPKLQDDFLRELELDGNFTTLDVDLPDQGFVRGEAFMFIDREGIPVTNEKGEFFLMPLDVRIYATAAIQRTFEEKRRRESFIERSRREFAEQKEKERAMEVRRRTRREFEGAQR